MQKRRFGFPITFQKTGLKITRVHNGDSGVLPCNKQTCRKKDGAQFYIHNSNPQDLSYFEHINDKTCPKQTDKVIRNRRPKYALDLDQNDMAKPSKRRKI